MGRALLIALLGLAMLQPVLAADAPSIETLQETLARSRSPEVRAAAATGLGRIGSEEAAPALLRALDDEKCVRVAAEEALALIGEAALPWLEKRYRQSDTVERQRIITVVRKIPAEAAADLLLAHLDEDDEMLRCFVAESLGAYQLPRVTEALVAALADASPHVRHDAAVSLGRLRSREAAGPLLSLLGDRIPQIRKAAVLALVAISGQDFGEDEHSWRRWLEQTSP